MSSTPFDIVEAVFAALQGAAELAQAKHVNNPVSPSALRDGSRVVFVEDGDDSLIDQPGQRARRVFAFTVGNISRAPGAAQARTEADADMQHIKRIVKAAHTQLIGTHKVGPLRHRSTQFRLDGLDVGGALRLMTFEAEYEDKP